MGRINVLPPDLVSKIAAGEVIDRPASVVKEIVENASDAGADRIELEIKDAGATLIRISDNGCGIAEDDLDRLFIRHSTSKITSFDDLFNVHSFGFRGEALFSIGAVADVTLRTRAEGQDSGWELCMRGGALVSKKPCACTRGSELIIKELFFNTPARRKFLKSDATENGQITAAFVPYALLYPQKQFTLKSDGKVTFESRPASDRLTQCAKSLGLDAKALRRVVSDAPEYQLHAELILGDASIRRSKKDLQFIFVNDRPVSNRDVSAALTQVYRNILPPGSHPFFAVYITVPSDSIDVNVHPSKREIKMKHDRSIAGCIGAWAKQTLLESSGTVAYKIDDTTVLPEQTFLRPSFASIQSARPAASQERAAEYQATLKEAFADAQKHFAIGQVHDSAYEVETAENIAHIGLRQKLEHADYAGSYRKKYILFDADESLLVIDQHAAHERINFEIFLKSLQNGNIETQPLLAPLTLSLSPFEKVGLNEKIAEINTLGFDVALFDANTLAIHAHPALLRDAASAVRNLIAGSPADLRTKDKAARMACRASVMSGDRITQTESENLRKRLLACENPFTCPHGRPTVIELAESELAKQFLR